MKKEKKMNISFRVPRSLNIFTFPTYCPLLLLLFFFFSSLELPLQKNESVSDSMTYINVSMI